MNPKLRLTLFCLMYLLPPAILLTGLLDYRYRYHIMVPVILLSISHAAFHRFSWKALGIRKDNLGEALAMQAGITVTATLIAIAFLHLGLLRQLEDIPQNPWFYLMYAIISGPVQELAYRSIPFAEMEKHDYLPEWAKIVLVIFLFAWLHVIYCDALILAVTTIAGAAWTLIYRWKPNYWAVSITHAACGLLAIGNGLI